MKITIALTSLLTLMVSFVQAQLPAPEQYTVKGGTLSIQPIMHATMVMSYHKKTIYVDPTGGAEAFKGVANPDIILITDIHGDHMDAKTLQAINTKKTTFVVPKAVADKLPADLNKQKMIVLNNGESKMLAGIKIEAIPMYNLPVAADAFHAKGRGNGYVLTIGGKRVYISGDTEDIPEMRALKNIDIAFVCMNLPYTMDVTQAAPGVVAFKPKVVYPYHYRGQDVNVFKKLVNEADKDIEVKLVNWYPTAK